MKTASSMFSSSGIGVVGLGLHAFKLSLHALKSGGGDIGTAIGFTAVDSIGIIPGAT